MINLNCCSQDEYDKWIGKLVRVIKITEYSDYYFVINKRKEGLAHWTKIKDEADIFIVPSSYCLLEHLNLQTIDTYSIYLQEVNYEKQSQI
jgi:hypothetical protein